MMRTSILLCAAALTAAPTQSEPAPRTLTGFPLNLDLDLVQVAAVRELANGHLLISDAGGPAILVVDPATGATRKIGREGQGPNEFRRPGGIYYDTDGTTSLIVDRAQPRVFVIDKTGALTAMRSIEIRGTQRSADDSDPMRIDASLHTYFEDQGFMFRASAGQGVSDSISLIRFDVAQQKPDTAARLFRTKPTVTTQGRMTFGRSPVFSLADGWGVANDGSIAVVRATPYRVDWISPAGKTAAGTAVAYTPVAVSDADREEREKNQAKSIVSGSATSKEGRTTTMSSSDFKTEYAKVKPPFDPQKIVVGPDNKVWVGRYLPANAKQVVYDVFDRRGARVDRIALPARSRIVGFGPSALFVAELDDDDLPHLKKYRLTN